MVDLKSRGADGDGLARWCAILKLRTHGGAVVSRRRNREMAAMIRPWLRDGLDAGDVEVQLRRLDLEELYRWFGSPRELIQSGDCRGDHELNWVVVIS